MSRLPARVLSRIREIQAELRTVVDGGPPALEMVTAALPELLGVDKALGYGLGPKGGSPSG
jgi:hypothetical protein